MPSPTSPRYVVIFRARAAQLDPEYAALAASLRAKALSHFGCREFVALTEGDEEIALSYWDALSDIEAWRQDAEHQMAQRLGRTRWYQHYAVEVTEIRRAYRHESR